MLQFHNVSVCRIRCNLIIHFQTPKSRMHSETISSPDRPAEKPRFERNPIVCIELLELPVEILELLLRIYLNVKSIQSLASTCSYFNSLVHSRTIPSVVLPLTSDFLKVKVQLFTDDKELLKKYNKLN